MSHHFNNNNGDMAYLKARLALYKKAVIGLLAVAVLLLGLYLGKIFSSAETASQTAGANRLLSEQMGPPAPYAKEIMEIIKPLEYSGVQVFVNSDVYLSLDTIDKTWTLHNIRYFDDSGNIMLMDNKYGTCGELSSYVYRKIYPLFSREYDIEFVRAAQSGFFLSNTSSHIVLEIRKKGAESGAQEKFVLDPSFKRYGPIGDFEDYVFFEHAPELDFVRNRDTFVRLTANESIPLLIRRDYLLSFVVESVNGRFDKQNFTIALTLNKQYRYAGRFIFALRRENGEDSMLENRELIVNKKLLSPREYELLRDKISTLFNETGRKGR